MQVISSEPSTPTTTLGYALFATRWLQAPLYFGLVAAQGVYVYKFFNELWTLILRCVTGQATEAYVMLAVLKLVDVVMIANLLIMVIVGGYETFVSRIGLQGHRDQPEWLSHVNSDVLKVKLATAIVGISSVHLLQMFVDVHHTSRHALLWGTVIHMAFIVSAAILAYMSGPMAAQGAHQGHRDTGREEREPKAFVPAQAVSREDGPSGEEWLRAAGFPGRKLLEDFDSEHPRSFDRETVARLGKLDFLAAGRNVVFVGPPGTGKTHLAVGLGVRACQAGHSVLYATAAQWAARLARARDAGRLTEELTALDAHPLLIVDEAGYTPLDAEAAALFQLVPPLTQAGQSEVVDQWPLHGHPLRDQGLRPGHRKGQGQRGGGRRGPRSEYGDQGGRRDEGGRGGGGTGTGGTGTHRDVGPFQEGGGTGGAPAGRAARTRVGVGVGRAGPGGAGSAR